MQRNIIVFIVLSSLILGGWFWMMYTANNEAEKKLAEVAKNKDKDKDLKPKEQEKEPEKKKEKPKEIEKKIEEPKEPKQEEKKVPAKPAQTKTLGGAGYHLTVQTISRGAGIR